MLLNYYEKFLKFLMDHRLPCIFNDVTGLYCPGCGGTRALIALLSGDPVKSFILHPFLIVAIVEVIIVVIQRIRKGYFSLSNTEVAVLLTVLFGQWIIKDVFLLCGVDIIALAEVM